MIPKDFMTGILQDIKVDLADEFDRNFERQAFFDKPWAQRKMRPGGNILNVHGGQGLRGSIMASIGGNKILFTSSLPYASIHNEGGTITITAKMKKFFWAMYYKSNNAVVFSTKTKAARNNQRNKTLSTEADYWKALALKKVGDKLVIPQRQIIGSHPTVKKIVEQDVDNAVIRLGQALQIEFKKVN